MNSEILIILGPIFFVLFLSIIFFSYFYKKRKVINYAKKITNNEQIFTPNEFFNMYCNLKKNKVKISNVDSCGIYVIFNTSKQIHYVGQSINVLKRVNNHFTGKGNGDVYADYKYKDIFQITIIKCEKDKLNAMEKHYINKFKAFKYGYNKNSGTGSKWI